MEEEREDAATHLCTEIQAENVHGVALVVVLGGSLIQDLVYPRPYGLQKLLLGKSRPIEFERHLPNDKTRRQP